MSELLGAFQRRHQEKLGQIKHREDDEAFLDGVHILIADLRQAGAAVADPVERGQLRALLHFWGNVAYDLTGTYPDTALLPLDPAHARSAEEPPRRALPPLLWILIGGAAALIIAAGLVAIGWLSRDGAAQVGVAGGGVTPTSAPVSSVQYATIEVMLGEEGAVADVFCRGTADIVARFTLEGVRPETVWYWELRREGETVAAQPAATWGRGTDPVVAHVLSGGPEGIPPGRYDLRVYADGQVVGAHVFQVLDVAPSVSDLVVSDVPWPVGGAAGSPAGEGAFDAGLRVLYLSYRYEGACPGLRMAHVLYYQGEVVQEIVETWWGGVFQGQRLVSIQAMDGRPFPPGGYEAAVIVAGQEQARAAFAIQGEVAVVPEGPPTFGEITLALGVQPDGTPILTEAGNRFDWNTKAVYAVFDYSGMGEGVRWAAVWTYNEQEVARQEGVWDVEARRAAGTAWVVYYDEDRWTLASGRYTVTLYIEDEIQATAAFEIRFPPQE